jgi:hypothetical protein
MIAALVGGSLVVYAVAGIIFPVLRSLWPAYAAAEPEKAYSLAMLLTRLGIGVLCAAIGGCVATIVAGDDGRAGWWFGVLFLVVSLPTHLYYVWDDYPAWYHFLYLAYLVPVAGLSARSLRASVGNQTFRRSVVAGAR